MKAHFDKYVTTRQMAKIVDKIEKKANVSVEDKHLYFYFEKNGIRYDLYNLDCKGLNIYMDDIEDINNKLKDVVTVPVVMEELFDCVDKWFKVPNRKKAIKYYIMLLTGYYSARVEKKLIRYLASYSIEAIKETLSCLTDMEEFEKYIILDRNIEDGRKRIQ